MVAALGGCRSGAYEDVYRQKMAKEIRQLEDKLYAAEYENEVLENRLSRQQARTEELREELDEPESTESAPASLGTPGVTSPLPGAEPISPLDPDQTDEEEAGVDIDIDLDSTTPRQTEQEADEDLQLPEMDPGFPANGPPRIDATDGREPTDEQKSADQRKSPRPSTDRPDEAPAESELLPAPTGPQPPGKEDTDLPPVIEGEILPPPASPEEIKPPGQIQLPDSAQAAAGVPATLRIHRNLSGGNHVDGKLQEMRLVVNAVDSLGKTVDLDDFDIAGELSVVVLDPKRAPDEARLGRWDFRDEELSALVRSEPISSLHIVVPIADKQPQGDEVIVHVRLRGEEDEMRCESRLPVEAKTAASQWTPRG